MKKINWKKAYEFIKENPRYLFFASGIVVQILEQAGIMVSPETVELIMDVVTLIATGRVMKKSDFNKML